MSYIIVTFKKLTNQNIKTPEKSDIINDDQAYSFKQNK